MTSTTSDEAPSRTVTWQILIMLAGLSASGALATNIILPAFAEIGTALQVSTQELGLTLSSFFTTFALGQLVVGPLSDRFGRRPLVLGGLVVFVLGSLVCATADSLSVMIVGRMIQALGACAASVLSRAIARDLFRGDGLARALALTMIAGAAAPGFSPLLGSTLQAGFGWRSTFLFAGAAGLLIALYYTLSVGETQPSGYRKPLSFGAVARGYAVLLKDTQFLFPGLAVGFILGGLYTFFSVAPSVLMNQLGLEPTHLGLYFAATVVVVFVAGFLAPRFARRWGHNRSAMAGIVISLIGSIALFSFAVTPSISTYTAAISLYLFGMGITNPLGTAITLTPFGERAGTASALLGFLQMGLAAVGATLASLLPFSSSFSLAAILTTSSALALWSFAPVLSGAFIPPQAGAR